MAPNIVTNTSIKLVYSFRFGNHCVYHHHIMNQEKEQKRIRLNMHAESFYENQYPRKTFFFQDGHQESF